MKPLDAKKWLDEIWPDITSIIKDDPDELKNRNERFGAYLVYLSTLITKYRFEARGAKTGYEQENPRPEKGIKQWEEGRDATTAKARYWSEYLTDLQTDLRTRISLSQTALNFERASLQTYGVDNA